MHQGSVMLDFFIFFFAGALWGIAFRGVYESERARLIDDGKLHREKRGW